MNPVHAQETDLARWEPMPGVEDPDSATDSHSDAATAEEIPPASALDPDSGVESRVELRRRLFGLSRPANTSLGFWLLIGVAVLSLWCVLFAAVLTPLQEAWSQRSLRSALRADIADGSAATGGRIDVGTPVALLQMPDIGVRDLVVVEGTSAGDLEDGPGHRRDTPLPGQVGVSVLMGRSVLFGAPFADIVDLDAGSEITVTTGEGTFRYRVEGVRRPGDAVPEPIVAPAGRLTLITSEPVGKGLGASRRTVYVDARLLDAARPASAARPAFVRENETSMQGDQHALGGLALWLGALILALVVAAFAYPRWGRRRTALVGVPVAIVLLWFAAAAAARLVPNLM